MQALLLLILYFALLEHVVVRTPCTAAVVFAVDWLLLCSTVPFVCLFVYVTICLLVFVCSVVPVVFVVVLFFVVVCLFLSLFSVLLFVSIYRHANCHVGQRRATFRVIMDDQVQPRERVSRYNHEAATRLAIELQLVLPSDTQTMQDSKDSTYQHWNDIASRVTSCPSLQQFQSPLKKGKLKISTSVPEIRTHRNVNAERIDFHQLAGLALNFTLLQLCVFQRSRDQ